MSDLLAAIGIDPALERQLTGSQWTGRASVTTQVQGLAELEAALDALPKKLAGGALRQAVEEATELVRQRAIEVAPYDASDRHRPAWKKRHLQDSILKTIEMSSTSVAGSWIRGKIGLLHDAFYGRILEFGWTPAGGREKIEGRPWMQGAFDDEKYRAIVVFETRLSSGLEAAARELHRQ